MFKYIGVIVNSYSSWNDHMKYVCSKISENINIITKYKKYRARESLLCIYYTRIYSYLKYGSTLWANYHLVLYLKFQGFKIRLIKLINNVPLRANITPHYFNSIIFEFPDIVKLYPFFILYVIWISWII